VVGGPPRRVERCEGAPLSTVDRDHRASAFCGSYRIGKPLAGYEGPRGGNLIVGIRARRAPVHTLARKLPPKAWAIGLAAHQQVQVHRWSTVAPARGTRSGSLRQARVGQIGETFKGGGSWGQTRAHSLVWLEHPADNREVVGSNPTGPTYRQRVAAPREDLPARIVPDFGQRRSADAPRADRPPPGRPLSRALATA
jgi:hypothetical protein